ncbi:transglutaminase family protein [Nanoarchaeota archaeon]
MSRRKKKGKKAGPGKETGTDPEDISIKGLSYWTRSRKLIAALIVAAGFGGTVHAIDSCNEDYQRQAAFEQHVERRFSYFKKAPHPKKHIETCLRPGSKVTVLDSSMSLFSVYSHKKRVTAVDGKKTYGSICIRPSDRPQDVDLESRIIISGLDHDDLEGFIRYNARLKLVTELPDILLKDHSITGLKINSKDIPLKYLTGGMRDHKEQETTHFLDLAKLVKDGVLTDDDFGTHIDVWITSHMGLDKAPAMDIDNIAGVKDYGQLPASIEKYTKSETNFPADHPAIKKLVNFYEDMPGADDNVNLKMIYALGIVNDSLRYHTEELYLDPVAALKDGRGDCDDYASIYVTILRSFGIPARFVVGNLTNNDGSRLDPMRHGWVEAYVPFKDGSKRWVLVEPTWADDKPDPLTYINYSDSKYLYGVAFDAFLETDKKDRIDVFQEHHWISDREGKDRKKECPVCYSGAEGDKR